MARQPLSGEAPRPRFLPCGDTALVVEFGDRIDRAMSDRVLRLDARLRRAAPPGLVETVPTFRSLMIHYDPRRTDQAALVGAVSALLDDAGGGAVAARLWRVPVCYEADLAPDLAEVAARTGLAPAEVVARHAGRRYHVYMMGFLPGYPYMGDLDEALRLPRRADPRLRVPAGAVAIATAMTAIYPLESPGGWHLIGTTPIRAFDPRHSPPVLFAPGDGVVFEPIDQTRFGELRAAVREDRYAVPVEPLPS